MSSPLPLPEPLGLAFGSGVGRVSEEALAVRCPLELALEAAPQAYVLLTLRGWDGEAALFIQRQVTVRVRVLVCRDTCVGETFGMKVGEAPGGRARKVEPPQE